MIETIDEEEILDIIRMRNAFDDFVETYHKFHIENAEKLKELKSDPIMKNQFIRKHLYLKNSKKIA